MAFATAVNPTFADYRTALRNALTGAGFVETALSGSSEFGYTLGTSGHNVAIKMDPNIIEAVPFSGTVNSGAAWTAQNGTVVSAGTAARQVRQNPLAANMTNYWIFSDVITADEVVYVHAVCEVSPGVFSHFMVGVLNKTGSYTGGAYVQSTYVDDGGSTRNEMVMPFGANVYNQRSTYVSLIGNILNSDDTAISNGEDFLRSNCGFNHYGWDTQSFGNGEAVLVQDLYTAGTNTQNGLTPLLPLYARMQVDAVNDYLMLLGTPYDVRLINLRHFQGGDTLTIGADTWHLFPLWTKGANHLFAPVDGSGDVTDSGYFGLAYKQIP